MTLNVPTFQRANVPTLLLLTLFLSASPAWALRIVSLMPSNTEIVEALGSGDDLVGVTRYDHIPAGSVRRNVGDFYTPQWEVIVALKPDVVLSGDWSSSPAAQRLKSLSLESVDVRHPSTLPELYDTIRQIGRAIGRPDEAAEGVIRAMQRDLASLADRRRQAPMRRVFIQIDPPAWTIGARDPLNDALRLVKLQNVYGETPRRAVEASVEAVVEKNPEWILVFDASAATLARRPGWQSIAAVKRGWIIDDLPADDLVRPSPRLVRGLTGLVERMERLEHAR